MTTAHHFVGKTLRIGDGMTDDKPAAPDPALLNSMALRYRHDFGLIEDERERESILTTMRQLWEEVVGLGFYRAPAAPSAALPDAEEGK